MHHDIRQCGCWVGIAFAMAVLLSTQATKADDASFTVRTAQQTTQLSPTSGSNSDLEIQNVGFRHYGYRRFGRWGYGFRPYYSSRFYYGYPYGRFWNRPYFYGYSYYRPYAFYRSSFYRPWYTYGPSYYYAPAYYAPAYYAPAYYAPTYYYGTYGLGCLY